MKVLIIDDSEQIRKALCELLEGLNWKTDTAASGPEGLEKIKKASYRLLVTRRDLQGISGEEIIKEVKRILPEIKTILITREPLSSTEEANIKDAGVDEIWQKPFSAKRIVQFLQQIQGGG
jgi:CheY-like chemotaxis protein